MRKTALIFILLVLVGYAASPVRITLPGATGMVSNTDISENKETDCRWLLNADVSTTIGQAKRRHGIKTLGNNAQKVYDPIGLSIPSETHKQIVAIGEQLDSIDTGSSYYVFPTDSTARNICYSDSFGSNAHHDSIITGGILLGAGPYNLIARNEHIVVCDGDNIPYIYGIRNDTSTYEPRAVSLGLEAPGQLRVGPLADSGKLNGLYRYAASYNTVAGKPSRWLSLTNQKAYVTLFECEPVFGAFPTCTTYLWRQKWGADWLRIDTVIYDSNQNVFVIDNVDDADGDATTGILGDAIMVADTTRPGALCWVDTIFMNSNALTDMWADIHTATMDSTYYFAYSYYDSILDMESPLGPISSSVLTTDTNGVTIYGAVIFGYKKGYTKSNRPAIMRLYRSQMNDSTTFYCIAQLPSNNERSCGLPDSTTRYVFFPGQGGDDDLTDNMAWFGQENTHLAAYDTCHYYSVTPFGDDGNIVTVPPYNAALEIPFSIMAVANDRLWGAGDALYPNRVYYSDYDKLTGWLATSYIECGESSADEIVALRSVPSGGEEILLIFRHNDVWGITGYDNETTVYPSVEAPARARYRVTDKCGAVNEQCVIGVSDAVYFLSPNMKIYRTMGDTPENISQPIENYIDSFFVDFYHADSHVVAYRLEDKVCWYDSTVNRVLAYNFQSGLWGIESYADNFRPSGSFAYDTSQSVYGRAERSYWLYQSDSACQFRTEYGSYVDSTDTMYSFPFNVEPPTIGDGIGFWEISEVQVTASMDSGAYLIGYVIDETGDTLATDSAQVFGYSTVRFGFGHNVGRYLSLRLSVSDDNTEAAIHDITIYPVSIGQTSTR
jgi:hypothetical protein